MPPTRENMRKLVADLASIETDVASVLALPLGCTKILHDDERVHDH